MEYREVGGYMRDHSSFDIARNEIELLTIIGCKCD